MQDVSIFWLRVAAAFYFPGLLAAVFSVIARRPLQFRPALALFTVAALLHFVSLVDLARQTKRFPAETFYESISLCAFLLAVLFLFVNWRYQFASLSTFLFPLVSVMTLVGATGAPVSTWTDPRVRNAWLLLHVTLAVAGYAALVIAAGASIFYILQERRLKSKQTADRLPPLATIDDLLSRSMALGFILITLAVVMGSIWAFIESGVSWIADPKIVVAWITWLGYLTIVFLRVSAGWRGRKAALMTIGVLGFSALTWATHIGIRSQLVK
jgi:ABC-type transport system involved in cytochrome c biogenesis permease subunit